MQFSDSVTEAVLIVLDWNYILMWISLHVIIVECNYLSRLSFDGFSYHPTAKGYCQDIILSLWYY